MNKGVLSRRNISVKILTKRNRERKNGQCHAQNGRGIYEMLLAEAVTLTLSYAPPLPPASCVCMEALGL